MRLSGPLFNFGPASGLDNLFAQNLPFVPPQAGLGQPFSWGGADQFQRGMGANPMQQQMMNAFVMGLVAALVDYLVQGGNLNQNGSGGCGCRSAGQMPGGFSNGRSVQPWGNSGAGNACGAPSLSGLPTGNGSVGNFLQAALAQNGKPYVFGAEASAGNRDPRALDCSELVEWASAQAGVRVPDGSGNQRAHCQPISVQQALRTPGALLFSNGHVAISLGDGRTIEARNSRMGVGIFPAGNRFTSAGLIPGMNYGA